MRLYVLVLVLFVWGVKATSDTTDDILVPKETLRFMLGCNSARTFGAPDAPLPVFHTDIDTETGITSQKVTLLDTEQLRQSLRGSVHSEEVLELIIGQLNAAVQGAATENSNRLRSDGLLHESNITTEGKECTINNNIDISVPAQEVDNFNDRVQMLIQQNSFLLLEQVNTLFTYKLRSLREDFENIVKERTKKINRKLDAVLKALGATPPAGGEEEDQTELVDSSLDSESTTDISAEVDTSTDTPIVEEDDDTATEEPTEEIPEDTFDSTGTVIVDKTIRRPMRPFRTRYQSRPTEESSEDDIDSTNTVHTVPVTRRRPGPPSRYQSRPSPSRTPAVRPDNSERPESRQGENSRQNLLKRRRQSLLLQRRRSNRQEETQE